MRSPWRWFVSVLVLASAGGAVWYFAHQYGRSVSIPVSDKKPATRPQSVSVTAISRQNIEVQVQALGTVTPWQQVMVRSRVDGELMSLPFKEGDNVKKGQLLATIDPRPLQAALAQHQAQEKRDLALLHNAKVDLKRYQQLAQDEAVSSQQIDTQQALVKQYEANVAGTRAVIANTELQLSYCHIHAPLSGRLGLRKVDVGNHIRANDAEGLVHIAQVDPIAVVFSLPEQQGMQLYQQMQASRARWMVSAWQRDSLSVLAAGQIESVDNQIESATGTLKFKARFENPQERLMPNQFVRIRLTTQTLNQVMTLPLAAVLTREQGEFIYQVQSDDTVIQRPIKVVHRNETLSVIEWVDQDSRTPIDEKLPVVLEGADKLRAGSAVKYAKASRADASSKAE